MSESVPAKGMRTMLEKLVAPIAAATATALTALWYLAADWLFALLRDKLGARWTVGLLCAAIAVCVWSLLALIAERKKKSFFERLVPVPGAGYSRDPKNGEVACPRCVMESHPAYMKKVGKNYICLACGKPVPGVEE